MSIASIMKNKPNNVTSLIKRKYLKKAKEILNEEFELIGSSDNDPDFDSIHEKVEVDFLKHLREINI